MTAAPCDPPPANRALTDECGQAMAEYAAALTVITIGVMTVIAALSGGVVQAVQNVVDVFP